MSAPGGRAGAVAAARDLLAELVEIPSPSGSEGRVVERVEAHCAQHGMPVARVSSEIGHDSLVLGSREPELVIAAHLDTIAPTWPARAVVDGDVVRGLGALDDKGGVVTCLTAAAALLERGADLDALGVAFAFPVDEERGGSGSRTLALALAPSYAIALEATGLRPGTVEAGGVEAWVHVPGRSAHGALAEIGENAIHAAVELIAALPELDLGGHAHELLGASRAEIAAIRGGTDFNTVPDLCSFRIEIMVVPGQDPRGALAELEQLAGRHGGRVEVVELTEPFEIDPGSPLLVELDAATERVVGAGPERIGVPSWTDAHNFVDFGGAEALVYGPGDFATAHTPDEHLDANEIVACAEVFVELAKAGWRR